MTFPRLASSLRLLLLSLGAAGFVLAAVSLSLDVVLFAKSRASAEASPAPAAVSGILHWNDLEPENSTAFAVHLRALGCPEATIARLCGGSAEDGQASASVISEPARTEGMEVSAEEDSLPTAAPVAVASTVPAMTAPAAQLAAAALSSGASPTTAGTSVAQNSGASSGTTYSGSNARAHARNMASGAYARTAAAAGGGASAGAANAGTASSDPVIVAPAGSDVKIPLAYQPADPSLSLNETQRAQWTRLQDQFANQVTADSTPSATPQDGQSAASATPASVTPDAKTWKTAQVSNDEMFRILYGEDAWLRQQVQANLHKSDTGATTP
jgi:hypothetical protein